METDTIHAIAGGTDGPDFAVSVPKDGYRWWYVDGVSDDGESAIVIIAFIGSVFSPYYYAARARGLGEPENFCAINVALYGGPASRWCMTERDRAALARDRATFTVGPSSLHWSDNTLVIDIDERSMPFMQAVRGSVRLRPMLVNDQAFALDAESRHVWQPLAPRAGIAVDFDAPELQWKGSGYFDTNFGARPLEADFRSWSWSRNDTDGAVDIRYNVTMRDNSRRGTHLYFADDSTIASRPVAPASELDKGLWRVRRHAHTDEAPELVRDLEDTPFYTRSLLETRDDRHIMHEYLDMQRFEKAWVRTLLPFRMPRRRWKKRGR